MLQIDGMWGHLAWTQLWQVTLVALIAALVARLACRQRPHLAYLVWLVVLVKSLTPPIWSSPTGLFSWVEATPVASVDAGALARHPHPAAVGASEALSGDPAVESDQSRLTVAVDAVALANRPAAGIRPGAGTGSDRIVNQLLLSFLNVLVVVWIIGALAQALIALAAVIRWGGTIRCEQVCVPPKLAALFDDLTRRLGIRRNVRLIVTSRPVGPVTYGWLHPKIVLPEVLVGSRSTGELEPLLAHELIHVRRGDALVGLLQLIVQALWWFHPLLRWANRQLAAERERSCDEEVIAALDLPPAQYVDELLGVLELKLSFRIPLALPGMRRSEITRQRMQHLLSHAGPFQLRTPRRYWLLAVAAALLLVPGAGLAGSAEPQEKTPETALPESGAKGQEDKAETPAPPEPQHADAKHSESKIHLSNVQQSAGSEPGSVVLSFQVDEPTGTQFQIEYRQWGVRGAYGTGTILTVNRKSAVVHVTISYIPQFSGDRNTSVLESREEQLIYRVDAKGVAEPGVATFVSAPLWNVAPEERETRLIAEETELGVETKSGGRRILLTCRKAQAGQDLDAVQPRAEIAVYRNSTPPAHPLTVNQALTRAWSRQTDEIGSAHIRYRLIRLGEDMLAPLSREEVNRILADADLAKHPEEFARAAARLMLPEKLNGETELKPTPREFFSAGRNWRDEWEDGAGVCDGESEFWYDSLNNQIDVYARGASHLGHTDVRDFRIFFDPGSATPYEQEALPNGRVRLWDSHSEWMLDADIGFVERFMLESPRTGQVWERFQYLPLRYRGGITMPVVKVETHYRGGQLSVLEMWKVDKGEFNDGLPAGIFHMAAKGGTKVFLRRGYSVELKADTTDLAEFLRSRPDLIPEWLMNWPDDVR